MTQHSWFSEQEHEAAELFFADLMGHPRRARPAVIESGAWSMAPSDEAVLQGGRGTFRHAPLDRGSDHNVAARWNIDETTPSGTSIDIVVHLHGFGRTRSNFIDHKADIGGLNFLDSAGAVNVRARRPTLALMPRGVHKGGKRWSHSNLRNPAQFNALAVAGINWFATSVLGMPAMGPHLMMGRTTVMAHSGGGSGLSRLLSAGLDPDEVVCYDSTYGGETPIIAWATRHIGGSAPTRRALRVFYRPCWKGGWRFDSKKNRWRLAETEIRARRIHHAIERAIAALPASDRAAVAARYRVHRSTHGHSAIPAAYTGLLLNDITATDGTMKAPPPASSRPTCAANSDWLTAPPRRPQ